MGEQLNFIFDPVALEELANKYSEDYAKAVPFSHIVIDNFLPEETVAQVLEEFPNHKQIKWIRFDDAAQRKLASNVENTIGDKTRFLLYQFNSSIFINFLEKLTRIKGLLPDPHLTGGGLHQIQKGGFLKVHADFNRHPLLPLDRRLNLLVYLNEDWKEEYGGHLELWSKDMSECKVRVLPVINRCVIFSTTDYSFHGHPEPLTCPEGRTRRSLALYYYSNGRPEEEISAGHDTLFQQRPGETFQQRAGQQPLDGAAKQLIRKFVPPVVLDIYRSLRRRS